MIFAQDREQMRRMYCSAWSDHLEGRPLEPLQTVIVEVIQQHPEYHALLESPDKSLARDYFPEQGETNPFLHMGLHLALHEQVTTDRPAGIRNVYTQLLESTGDVHELQHSMMDCLAEAIWTAQRNAQPPDETRYLDCLRQLGEK